MIKQTWRSMESAPQDGRLFYVRHPSWSGVGIGWFNPLQPHFPWCVLMHERDDVYLHRVDFAGDVQSKFMLRKSIEQFLYNAPLEWAPLLIPARGFYV